MCYLGYGDYQIRTSNPRNGASGLHCSVLWHGNRGAYTDARAQVNAGAKSHRVAGANTFVHGFPYGYAHPITGTNSVALA